MAFVVHYVHTANQKDIFALWDTTLRGYRTEWMREVEMMACLSRLLDQAGLASSPSRDHVTRDMVDASFNTIRTGPETEPRRAPRSRTWIGGIRLAYELAHQVLDVLRTEEFSLVINRLTEPDHETFLKRTNVLDELLLRSGRAHVRPTNGRTVERDGYRDVAHALALAEEIRAACNWLSVEIENTDPSGPRIVFSLL